MTGRKRKAKPFTWEDAFRLCCGEIGMSAAQFYALQYCELELILQGHRERSRREWRERHEEHAWVLWWMLLPHQSKDADDPLTIDKILGRKPRSIGRQFANDEDKARALISAFRAQSEKKKKRARVKDGK